MLLATRCPFCESVFRLLPEQLALRGGRVRCGRCKQVFDASSSLFDVSNGVGIDQAKHVTIDDVTAYTLDKLGQGGLPAAAPTGVETPPPLAPFAPSAPADSAPAAAQPVEEHTVEPVAPHGVEPVIVPAEEPVVAPPASASHEAEAHASTHETDSTAAHAAVPPVEPASSTQDAHDTQDTPPGARPNFSADAWNPWAPAPDAAVDGRIRHNAASIPFNPVTIPRSAQPPLTLELTDSKPIDLEKTVARNSVDTPSRAEPTIDAHAAPHVEPRTEPTFDAAPERVLDRQESEVEELPPHTWRGADPALEPTPAPDEWTARESKAHGTEAPHNAPHTAPHEPLHGAETRFAPEADDRTFTPSDEHDRMEQNRPGEREPFFGTPSDDADFEPRFGGQTARAPFAEAPDEDDDAFAVKREPRTPDKSRLIWNISGGILAGLLGFLLIVQVAWWQRESVMVAWPDSQPLFIKACANLGCKIEPPRDIDGLLVEPSDLRQVDGPHKLELKMPLRNRFDLALAYPAVELTLLDENNNIALRRVLWPQDYVKPGTPIAAGLPARTTQTMIVRLDTGDAVASNFRVQIFYP